jgi:fructuronate reductase
LRRGHDTVAAALADPPCLRWVNDYWDAAARHLPAEELDLPAYRAALLQRLANPRIEYQLRQIATDNVAKLRVRIAPVVLAERAAGYDARAAIRALGTWVALVLGGANLDDTEAAAVDEARRRPCQQAVSELVELVEPLLLDDPVIVTALHEFVSEDRSE